VTSKQAVVVKAKVEALIAGNITGNVDDEVSRWVAGLDDKIHSRFAAVGLVPPRVVRRMSLGAFIDSFIASQPRVKPRTLENMKQVRRWLVDCLGANRDLRSVGQAEAEDVRLFMQQKGLGENTIRRHIGRARQLFKAAGRRGLTRDANPFQGMAATVRADKARLFFVSKEVATKVIDACPDDQWKLLFALCRYGGLRCPSEVLALKWSDVKWELNRIRVPSPKTAHIEGKEARIIPMFPELLPHLLKVFADAPPGDGYVITRYRNANANLRTQLGRIIGNAGVRPWPKLFQNLPSTRETELAENYPLHVVCAWIGNSLSVAKEHYLQITDLHFTRASKSDAAPSATRDKGAGKATQNPTQSGAVPDPQDLSTYDSGSDASSELLVGTAADETGRDERYPRQDSNL
jgi:integrase